MPVRIASRTIYSGSVSPSALNTETVVVNIPGDTVVIKEYMAVDGVNLRLYAQVTYNGPVSEPVIRFHTKTFKNEYKVTITQTAGVLRSFPYWFIVEVAEVF